MALLLYFKEDALYKKQMGFYQKDNLFQEILAKGVELRTGVSCKLKTPNWNNYALIRFSY